MNTEDTVSNVSRLLACFPGVTVHSAVHSDNERKTYISLRITSLQSVVRLAHHCQAGANVRFALFSGGEPLHYGKPFDESRAHYSMVFPDDDGRGSFSNPPAPLQILGIYLARDLKYLGLLAPEDADKLQTEWHGGHPF